MTNIKYAGKDFRQDLGLYVDSIESYGTPKKSYTFHEVLGRNGSLAVDDHRFEDHEETFNCYIRQDFVPNFRNVQAFFNSLKGYQRLERSNEPDYFEIGLYEGEISPRPTQLLKAGVFPFRLRLHPEKWLKSGETAVDAASTSETLEGNPIQFENPSGLTALTGLNVDIEPVQDLNGYEYPWVGGAGKNLLNYATATQSKNAIDFANVQFVNGETYTMTDYHANATMIAYKHGTSTRLFTSGYVSSYIYTATETELVDVRFYDGSGLEKDETYFQLERGAVSTPFSPYENICPITGHSSASVTMAVDGSATDYTIDLNGTRYGGTLNVLTGVLTLTKGVKIYDGTETWRTEYTYNFYADTGRGRGEQDNAFLCSHFRFNGILSPSTDVSKMPSCYISSSGNLNLQRADIEHTGDAMKAWCLEQYQNGTPLTVVFDLATPTTVQLTPQQVSLLTGTNIISTDMNDLTVTLSNPSELENLTLFESKPLIRIYGTGTVNINNDYITVDSSSPFAFIDLDCETMNASSAGNNANQYIEILNDAEITLKPGTNYVAYSGSITKVEITPRWYTI